MFIKENTRNRIIIYLLLSILFISCKAQERSKINNNTEIYSVIDKYINNYFSKNNTHNFEYLEISIKKQCNDYLIFMISMRILMYSSNKQYKVYNYKDKLIIYTIDEKERNNNILNFFDPYFEKSNFNINQIPKEGFYNGYQSIVIGNALLYLNNTFYGDTDMIQRYIDKDCIK
ncbi:hypothetical protein [Apibacter sp. HY039]|uniref:hypothetical protein n=1 Tax=Apibacter sp. HY039 TaxID=2501476 RepID=UPI000FEBA3E3|nr:hypothetical protein [Apibacter sp. HY039]